MPNAEALVVRLAPEGMRGAYLGTIGASAWAGGALAPATGLWIRDRWGDGAMWFAVAVASMAAAALYYRAAAEQRPEVVESSRWPPSTASTVPRTSTR
jgi:MFS family permease